jgi:hypothetical protein
MNTTRQRSHMIVRHARHTEEYATENFRAQNARNIPAQVVAAVVATTSTKVAWREWDWMPLPSEKG